MAKQEKLPPLVGRNPLVHLAGLAQSMERTYAATCTSSYRTRDEEQRDLEWAAQACALYALLETLGGFDKDQLDFYRERLDGYRVELALRYRPDASDNDA